MKRANKAPREQGPERRQDAAGRNEGAEHAANSNTVKNPDDWKTGDEPMTGAQRSYLHTLADEAGEPLKEDLSKAEASRKIDELQQKTGRGLDPEQSGPTRS